MNELNYLYFSFTIYLATASSKFRIIQSANLRKNTKSTKKHSLQQKSCIFVRDSKYRKLSKVIKNGN